MLAPISPVRSRIEKLRAAMQAANVHAVLVPSSDPHVSEYLPGRWQGRAWFSGFTGSMATLVVTLDDAALFADSRYWAQAKKELSGTGVALVKVAQAALKPVLEWIVAELKPGNTLSFDGQVLSLAGAQQVRSAMAAAGIAVKSDIDVLDAAWAGRPVLPDAPVYEHAAPEATVSRQDKLVSIRAAMTEAGATHHFISTVDDVAWLLNLRGADVTYNPVFVAHVLLDAQGATLFIADGKVDAALKARLAADGVKLAPYAEAPRALGALPKDAVLLVDPRRITLGLREA